MWGGAEHDSNVLDHQGFSATFDQGLLDSSSGHVAELKCFKHFNIPTRRISSMKVYGPDFALESATHAQPQARELCKIAALNANFLPNAVVSELIGKSSHVNENLNTARHHPTSSLIRTNHWKILKNPQNGFFKGIFSSVPRDGAQMKLMKRKFGQW